MTRQQRYFRTPKGRAALARAKRKYRQEHRMKIKEQKFADRMKIKEQKWADTKRLLGIQEATQC